MSKFLEDLKEYERLTKEVVNCGEKIMKKLIKAIKPTIPDIVGWLNGVQSDIDTITLTSDSHRHFTASNSSTYAPLESIISEVFPQLDWEGIILVDCLYGINASKEEAEQITKALIALRDDMK